MIVTVYSYFVKLGRDGDGFKEQFTFRPIKDSKAYARIMAPEGSEIKEKEGKATILKVPKRPGFPYDCWGLEATEALRAAQTGTHGLCIA